MVTQRSTRVVLASLPAELPSTDHFRVEEASIGDLQSGEVLLRTRLISVDANMRAHTLSLAGDINDALKPGCVIEADGTAEVLVSRHANFKPGQLVLARTGWQSHVRLPGELLDPLDPGIIPEETALFTLGTAARIAYSGLKYTAGHHAGETLAVPAATGVLGAMVGQFARMAGLWTVGVVSSTEESVFIQEKLGFHSSVSWNDPGFEQLLTKACPDGIDIFFETIGGALWRTVRPLMNLYGRIILAGPWAQYSHAFCGSAEYGSPVTMSAVVQKSLSVSVPHTDRVEFSQFAQEVARGVADGSIWSHVTLIDGLTSSTISMADSNRQAGRGLNGYSCLVQQL